MEGQQRKNWDFMVFSLIEVGFSSLKYYYFDESILLLLDFFSLDSLLRSSHNLSCTFIWLLRLYFAKLYVNEPH